MCPTAFLHCEPDHKSEKCSHEPAGGSWPGEKICREEGKDTLPRCFGIGIGKGELSKVEHVRHDVNSSPNDYGPCSSFMKGNVLVKWDEIVERGTTQKGDEVPADRKEDKNDIHMKNQGGSTSNGWGEDIKKCWEKVNCQLRTVRDTKSCPRINQIIF